MNNRLNSQNLREQKVENVLRTFFCEIIAYVLFASLFGIYSSEAKYHAGPFCSTKMLDWSKAACIFEAIKAGNSFFTMLILIVLTLKKMKTMPTSIFMYVYGFRALCFFAAFVLWIGLIVAYKDRGNCDRLAKLVLAYVIMTGIGIGILICCGCLLICVGGLAFGAMAAQKEQPVSSNNDNPI